MKVEPADIIKKLRENNSQIRKTVRVLGNSPSTVVN